VRERFSGAQSEADVLQVLGRLGADAKMDAIEIEEVGVQDVLARFIWLKDPSTQRPRDSVSARFPLRTEPSVDLKFVWQSEFGEVSPQMDILLQIVTDVLQTELRRVGSSLVRAGATARDSRPSLSAATATLPQA